MASKPSAPAEQLVDLRGQRLGDATRLMLELAGRLGYTAGATNPGTFRLARTQRKLLGKTTESVTVSVFEDRSGTKARFVGPIDAALVEHLVAAGGGASAAPVAPGPLPPGDGSAAAAGSGAIVAPGSAPIEMARSAPPSLPRPVQRPSAAVPGGMIAQVPGGVAQRLPVPRPSDVDGRTVMRPADPSPMSAPPPVVPTPAAALAPQPALVLADGTNLALVSPVVLGRDPDLGAAPAGSRPLAVADASLSKTHAVVVASDGQVMVTDLHSTNGTAVQFAGTSVRCTPGEPTPVPLGAVVVAGAVTVTVQR
ncbi:MAG: FHA domain-containing protein [Ilumatobacteraceae bacterium]